MKYQRILLIDDDEDDHEIFAAAIGKVGAFEYVTLNNARMALDKLISGAVKADVIFLDLNMPIMNGYEFIEAFALMDLPDKSSITIVVLTSSADPNDLARAKELGIKYYFNKPLTREEIKKMIGQEFSYDLN